MADGYKQTAEIAKALAHPIRLRILEELRSGEACVCHLEHILSQRQAYISQHLARLRQAGLVTDRRDGMNVFYALADEAVASLLDAARLAAIDIAATRDESLSFEPSSLPLLGKCPCPHCNTEVEAHPSLAESHATQS